MANEKVSIRLTTIREGDEISILIACTGRKGKDLLKPKTPTQQEIMNYFKEILKELG